MSQEELDLSLLPTNLKLQLLSLMNNKKTSNERPVKRVIVKKSEQQFAQNMITEIRKNGYFVCDNFVSNHSEEGKKLMNDAFAEIKLMQEEGSLKHAGMGEGVTKLLQEEKRGDFHCWLDAEDEKSDKPKTPAQLKAVIQKISKIRHALNRYVFYFFSFKLDVNSLNTLYL